ncbi:hypothetical protein H257_09682 [Aphanomyces astaci]|uniref:Uncharacterized protein n=1 Tax=Aphanomyces astaci TaxID=112090 RepID=W4GA47_APHAT|nr:hypothetical protein H257_09682 [Aphanomyces astaci]ETV76156.1 hypothetical protein H257_09682 [Aphanomyces astaci]|eukprot:XP_009834281.1 hypothetical protein H257_09682 [Aphanomyces astaci]
MERVRVHCVSSAVAVNDQLETRRSRVLAVDGVVTYANVCLESVLVVYVIAYTNTNTATNTASNTYVNTSGDVITNGRSNTSNATYTTNDTAKNDRNSNFKLVYNTPNVILVRHLLNWTSDRRGGQNHQHHERSWEQCRRGGYCITASALIERTLA